MKKIIHFQRNQITQSNHTIHGHCPGEASSPPTIRASRPDIPHSGDGKHKFKKLVHLVAC